MKTCAVCRLDNGLVINIIHAEPTDLAPYGCQLVEINDGVLCGVSWTWDGVNFIDSHPRPASE